MMKIACVVLLAWVCLGPEAGPVRAAEGAGPERSYREARARWEKERSSAEAGWQLGRACYSLAEQATNDTQRAALANEGIDACRRAVALAPTNAAGHYYLGLNLGQLAQTKLLGALKLIDQMEASWRQAIALEGKFDYAGGHRALGILYRDAPGWPTSIGNKSKGRQHLLKAVELAPEYPGNKLALLDSYVKWGERKTVQQQAAETEKFLKAAREKFSGETWALAWRDWDARWAKIKANAAVNVARSPRDH